LPDILRHLAADDVKRLIAGEFHDPHAVLGAHAGQGDVVIRAMHPDAETAEVVLQNGKIEMTRIHPGGLFAAIVKNAGPSISYRIRFKFADGNSWERGDPYSFLPTLGDLDLYLHGEGTHRRLYERLGAHRREIDGQDGVSFAVWAPTAKGVSLVGDFNRWDARLFPMRMVGGSGVWELFVPDVGPGAKYKFEIKTRDGRTCLKTDPYGFAMEGPPYSASIVWEPGQYAWNDSGWMDKRRAFDHRQRPMAIYEAHLGSWARREDGGHLTYRELGDRLVAHALRFGFTHIELLPVAEHPFEASWGYQVTGYFAPTHRHGPPDDFKYFVDVCHQNGIGVILDWVPAHFPKDDFSLGQFDGTALYEHEDPKQAEHADWGTLIFNFGRHEVKNFLIANALYWLDEYHIDALRVDAVASMLYLDYSRKEGEWVPNRYGGRENLEAIEFLRDLNRAVYGEFPGCFTIAEESTAWGGVTVPAHLGGLGFGFKWNMGWMHDTLEYFSRDPVHRSHHHDGLTFSMLYAHTENFVLPISHDEVVHGKKSLLEKLPGDTWQKFATLRLLLAYMYMHPGKKLLFMGTELASHNEWSHDVGLDWGLEADPMRRGLQDFLRDLGALYLEKRALWEWDSEGRGFSWIDCGDREQSVISFIRSCSTGHLVCIFNLTPIVRHDYRVGVPSGGRYRELLNTDAGWYGGGDVGNAGAATCEPVPFHGHPHSLSLTLPPLGCLILEPKLEPESGKG
jgi:1,4-alpha-glucan branching enzyme